MSKRNELQILAEEPPNDVVRLNMQDSAADALLDLFQERPETFLGCETEVLDPETSTDIQETHVSQNEIEELFKLKDARGDFKSWISGNSQLRDNVRFHVLFRNWARGSLAPNRFFSWVRDRYAISVVLLRFCKFLDDQLSLEEGHRRQLPILSRAAAEVLFLHEVSQYLTRLRTSGGQTESEPSIEAQNLIQFLEALFPQPGLEIGTSAAMLGGGDTVAPVQTTPSLIERLVTVWGFWWASWGGHNSLSLHGGAPLSEKSHECCMVTSQYLGSTEARDAILETKSEIDVIFCDYGRFIDPSRAEWLFKQVQILYIDVLDGLFR